MRLPGGVRKVEPSAPTLVFPCPDNSPLGPTRQIEVTPADSFATRASTKGSSDPIKPDSHPSSASSTLPVPGHYQLSHRQTSPSSRSCHQTPPAPSAARAVPHLTTSAISKFKLAPPLRSATDRHPRQPGSGAQIESGELDGPASRSRSAADRHHRGEAGLASPTQTRSRGPIRPPHWLASQPQTREEWRSRPRSRPGAAAHVDP